MLISRDEQSENFLDSDVINGDFVSTIVERKLDMAKDSFAVRLVLLTSATAKTDSYMSNVYRMKIKIIILATNERKTVDVVLKVLLEMYEIFGKFGIFERECIIYEDILQSLEVIWMERANEIVKFGPKYLKIVTSPYEVIVLGDLGAKGYKMLDRKIGLDVKQTKIALSKLAKFHAAGAVRYQKDGIVHNCLERKSSITPEMKREESKTLGVTLIQLYEALVENIRKMENCEIYADKIAKWDRTKILKYWLNVVNPMKCGMLVLTHADFWINNLMFKFNDLNEPEDVQFLDFQSTVWGTPAHDLHYFFISSIQDEVKVQFYDEFIKHYHQELSESLKKLNYEQHVPSLHEIHEDLLEKSQMVSMSMIYVLFSAKYESSKEFDLDYVTLNDQKDPEFFDRIYGNETYKKALKLWLPLFDERGYLDFMLPDNQEGEELDENVVDMK